MNTEEEKRNQRKGLYFTLGIHAGLLLLFAFLLAWKEPFPPIPEYGIELNFGTDDQGAGAEEPVVVSETPNEQPVENEPDNLDQSSEESEEEQTERLSEPDIEEIDNQPVDNAMDDKESPDVVTREVREQKTEEVSKESNEQKVSESPLPTEKGKTNPTTGATQGLDPKKAGDQGVPEGKIDKRAIYGKPGDSSGASLDMAGWTWDFIPKPNDPSQETGRIVFSITIDDVGEIISISTIQKTVTPAVERIYRAEVEKLTFSKTRDNTIPAPTSSGTITFIIKSN